MKNSKLKDIIQKKGLKQTDLSLELGLSKSALSQKINGLREFKKSEIIKLADYLGLTIDEVMR